MQRAKRREVVRAELVEANRRSEILEPVLAEIEQLGVAWLEQACGSGGEDGLAPVAGSGDAGGPMDFGADVVTVMEERFAAVQTGADADRAGQPLLDLRDGGDPVAGRSEDAEEGVALGVDLDPAVVDER